MGAFRQLGVKEPPVRQRGLSTVLSGEHYGRESLPGAVALLWHIFECTEV